MYVVAADTETHRISDRTEVVRGTQRVKTGPRIIPKIVCGTFAGKDGEGLLDPEAMASVMWRWLDDQDYHVVFHNAAFDIEVLCAAHPELSRPFEVAIEAGRIHDTKILDLRLRLAQGALDRPIFNSAGGVEFAQVRNRSLADCAAEYLGRTLDKDDALRLNFGAWEGRTHELPAEMVTYAVRDAVATLDLYRFFERQEGFPWDERIEVQASVVHAAMDRRGLAVDRKEATRLLLLFEQDVAPLERELVGHGLGSWEPIPGSRIRTRLKLGSNRLGLAPDWWLVDDNRHGQRCLRYKKHLVHERADMIFKLSQTEIRRRLGALAEAGVEHKRTPTGLLSINADDWKDRIPADDEALHCWLEYARLVKILNTYLRLYCRVDEVYPRINTTGARSGRTSYTSPNIQNVSKRRHGIRSLFLPRPDRVFIVSDYSQMELLTLAQAMLDMGIKGTLFDTIASGTDLHQSTARLLLGLDSDAPVTKSQRQAAKAVAFGCPGGLGPAKLRDYARKTFNVSWTLDEAREMRGRFFEAYPDAAEFLRRCRPDPDATCWRELGIPLDALVRSVGAENFWEARKRLDKRTLLRLERACTTKLRTGFVRSRARFTEAANCHFQGLAAAVTKRATWLAHVAGLKVVLVVHDELVVETAPLTAEADRATLETVMKKAFCDICLDVGPFSKVESDVRERWGKATDRDGKDV